MYFFSKIFNHLAASTALFLVLLALPARAADFPETQPAAIYVPWSLAQTANSTRSWAVTFYGSILNDEYLDGIILDGVRGRYKWRDAYFFGFGLNRTLTEFTLPNLFSPSQTIAGFRLEVEGQALQHVGLESFTEIAAAVLIRTPSMPLFGGASFNLALGDGGSYAIQHPAYEFGTTGIRGVKTPNFLNFMLAEAEFTNARFPRLHFVLSLHHRCSIYGLIAPTSDGVRATITGSNYMGFGLRADR